jgi:C1A family cysteine protease
MMGYNCDQVFFSIIIIIIIIIIICLFVAGCCWAFATVATLESAWQIKTGNLISLSAQFFVDCDWQSRACNGTDSLSYAYYLATLRAGGIPSEDDYPFRGVKQTCRNDALPTAGFRGFERILPVEDYLLQAVAQQPVAGYIAASDELKHFKGGEIYSGSCALELNHAVVIVGYGTSDDGTKYWLIRNSWGEEWGESGYFRLIRGTGIPGGHCGINSNYSFYPFI